MSNLKKCPFCGGEAKICGYYFIQCTKCGVSTLTYTDRESAINTWNTRIHTVEAKPVVHAKWDWGVLHKYPMCTNCQLESKDESDFCPNCGAKMDGKKVQDG